MHVHTCASGTCEHVHVLVQEARSGKKERQSVEKRKGKKGDMEYACVMEKEHRLTQQVEQHNVCYVVGMVV